MKSRIPRLLLAALALAGSAAWVLAALDSPHGPLKQDCASCHTPEGWTQRPDPLFRHDRDTGWALDGAHENLSCRSCHSELTFSTSQALCTACHQDTHQGSLGEECASCHGPLRWLDEERLRRRHDNSLFPLAGAHAQLACGRCHQGPESARFTTTSPVCGSCHLDTWRATSSPDHQASGLSQDCSRCHGSQRWTDAPGFAHATFPLQGAHARTSCNACHTDGIYEGTASTCFACHETAWRQAANPDHQAGNYPQTCEVCHTSAAWRPSAIDHDRTDFPLTGAHRSVSCTLCHVNGQYTGTSTDCGTCHDADWLAAENPNHQAGSYPHTCAQCHSTSAWRPASFDHSATDFPLTGAHTAVTCASCHVDGQYAGTDSRCQACHLSAWQGTGNPDHQAADFPLDCTLCHSTSRWEGAVFTHDQPWFPIYSGSHRGEWTSCAECHTTSGDYGQFSCLGCHEHSRSAMDSEHDDVGNYVYDSAACLNCHPDGRENDALDPGMRPHRWPPASQGHGR